jgi:ubiquinone/menaquinone biosynthesis C-methylase UbiE
VTTLEKSPEDAALQKTSGQQLVDALSGSKLSQLDWLILQNVAGKLGLPPYYPGQPDEETLAILGAAREAAGEAGVIGATASTLSNVMELYLRSDTAPHRGLTAPVEVTNEILALFERHPNIAQPLFIATRYLLARQYDKLKLADAALELGNGSGDTANSILGDRKLCIGSTPIIDENMGARANFGNHRHYMAIDASQIPFGGETFDTVTMNYTFYHLEQPERTCAEVFRVLRPGGALAFNFAVRDEVGDTRVLPALAAALGMEDHATRADNFVFVDYGAEADTPTLDAALAIVEKAGFEAIEVVRYLSAPLSRLIWLVRDFEIMLGMSAITSVSNPTIAARYRTFCTDVLAPLIANDEALSAAHGGTFAFVTARKPGEKQPSLSDVEVLARRCCPVSLEPLKDCGGWLEGKGVAYPVLRGIPLTIPVYAEMWTAQNPGVDPADRQEFQYLDD